MITYGMQSDSSLSMNHIREYQEWIVVRRDKVLKSTLWTKSEVGVTSNILYYVVKQLPDSLDKFDILHLYWKNRFQRKENRSTPPQCWIQSTSWLCIARVSGIAHRYVVLWSQQSWPCHEGTSLFRNDSYHLYPRGEIINGLSIIINGSKHFLILIWAGKKWYTQVALHKALLGTLLFTTSHFPDRDDLCLEIYTVTAPEVFRYINNCSAIII